jgi:pyrimidine oxygenase
LICAGMSARGLSFAVNCADICFIGGRTARERRETSQRARTLAAGLGRGTRTFMMCTVIHADTDAAAQALAIRYREGQDMAAIITMLSSWGAPPERLSSLAQAQGPFMTKTVVGSPTSCAAQIEAFMADSDLDGLMLVFPDYPAGIAMFAAEILPRLRAAFA